MARYTKGKAIAQGKVGINPRMFPKVERKLCSVCLSSGIIKSEDGYLIVCPNGCRPRSYKVKKMLEDQKKLYARLDEIKRGKW